MDNANRAIFEAANTREAYSGMGTTPVVGHVGDWGGLIHAAGCRAFRLPSLVTRALCVEDTVLLDRQAAISSGCVPTA